MFIWVAYYIAYFAWCAEVFGAARKRRGKYLVSKNDFGKVLFGVNIKNK